jgi:hypothetical protein
LQDLGGHYAGDVARQSIDHDFDWVHFFSPKFPSNMLSEKIR